MTASLPQKSDYTTLILPVLLYLGLATLYMLVIPAGESPDEPGHLQCIEQVTRYGRIPIVDPYPGGQKWWDRERIISGLMCTHMPLYYITTGYTQRLVGWLTQAPTHYTFPPSDPSFESSHTMFLHSQQGLLPNASEPAFLATLRLESILFGLITVVGTYILTGRLTGGDRLASGCAATLVAGWPQFLFMSRAINNDALATALAVATLVVLVSSRKPGRFVWAAVLAALTILAKITLFVVALALAATFLSDLVAAEPGGRRRYALPAAGSALVLAGLASLVILHPTLRSHLTWSQAAMGSVDPRTLEPGYWLDVASWTLQSGWGQFGWMAVRTPGWQAMVWWGFLTLASIAGIGFTLVQRGDKDRLRLTLIGVIWIASLFISYVRINLTRFQPQFRYILPMIPVLAAFAASGLFVILARQPRVRKWIIPATTALLLLANLWIVFYILVPLYG